MNLQSIAAWVVGVVLAAASIGKLDELRSWIWRSEAETIIASRASNWGSPRFFKPTSAPSKAKREKKSEVQ